MWQAPKQDPTQNPLYSQYVSFLKNLIMWLIKIMSYTHTKGWTL